MDVAGTLYEDEKALLELKSLHDGMGSFSILPHRDKKYLVKLEGVQTGYALPEIKPGGVVLRAVYNTPDTLALRVAQSHGLPRRTMYLRIQSRGRVQVLAGIDVDGEKTLKVPARLLPRGIAEVTLFDGEMLPLAERLVFANPERKIYIEASLDGEGHHARERVKIGIRAVDESGGPVVAHLGLSVHDAIYENVGDAKTIEAHYLLSTQLRGDVHDPGYYFDPQNGDRSQALDLLMLAQGWRAYEWREGNLERRALMARPFISDTLTGQVYAKGQRSGSPVGGQYVMAFAGDTGSGRALIEVDGTGGYTVLPEHLGLDKRGYVYIKLLSPEKGLGIRLDDPAPGRLKELLANGTIGYPLAAPKERAPMGDGRPYLVADGVNQLDEVVLAAKGERVFRDRYMGTLDSLAKYEGNMDYVCGYGTAKVLNCNISIHNHKKTKKPIDGEVYYKNTNTVPLGNGKYRIVKFDTHPPYKYPKYTEEELLEKYNLASIRGYYPKKEFYSPVYDGGEVQDGFPDHRNTLYWRPDIITDEDGEAEVEFYTSDLNTRFRGVIEGVSGDGLLGSQTFEFRVRRGN